MRATVTVCVLLVLGCEKSPPDPVAALPTAPVEASSPVPTPAERTPIEPSPVATPAERTPVAPTPTVPPTTTPTTAPVDPRQAVQPTATAPDAAATQAPAPAPARDAAYFHVRGRGLVRLSAGGVEVLYEHTSFPLDLDFAATDDGLVHLVANGRLFAIADGQRREIAVPPHMRVGQVAHATDRSPVIASEVGIFRRRGDGWGAVEPMDAAVPDFEAEQPQQLTVDAKGTVWARGQGSVFQSGRSGFRKERLPWTDGSNVVAVAVGGDGIVAAVNSHAVFVRRVIWQSHERLLGDLAFYSLTVGPDGTVVAGASDGVAILAPGAEPQTLPLDNMGLIIALARDARSRTWVVGTHNAVILGPDHTILRRWPVGKVPDLGGAVEDVQVTGQGPELPAQ